MYSTSQLTNKQLTDKCDRRSCRVGIASTNSSLPKIRNNAHPTLLADRGELDTVGCNGIVRPYLTDRLGTQSQRFNLNDTSLNIINLQSIPAQYR